MVMARKHLRHLYIFFTTARSRLPRWRQRQLSRLVRVLTLSRIAHCAVGYDDVVLHPTLGGVEYWPIEATIRHYPGLCALVKIPVTYGVNLQYFEPLMGVPMRGWPTFWRWLRFGHAKWPCDCLGITLACIQAGGVDVPHSIATPSGLYRWLVKEGYETRTDREFPHDPAGFQAACRHLIATRTT